MTTGIFLEALTPRSGKTLVSLGLADSLIRRADQVGYFRPVHLGETPEEDPGIRLMREAFNLDASAARGGVPLARCREILASGDQDELVSASLAIYSEMSQQFDVIIVDGTDMLAASAASAEFDLNARLANNMGCSVVAVINGSDAESVEDIVTSVEVARSEMHTAKSDLLAVVVNRVDPAIADDVAGSIPVGRRGGRAYVIPEDTAISHPTVDDVVHELRLDSDFPMSLDRDIQAVKVAAMTVGNFLEQMADGDFVITPADRSDVVMATLASALSPSFPVPSGLLLSGDLQTNPTTWDLIHAAPFPVLRSPVDTYSAAQAVGAVQGELRAGAPRKIAAALGQWSRRVDDKELLGRLELPRPATMTPLRFLHQLIEKARSDRRGIVLPEGEDVRVLRAAEIIQRRDFCDVTLLGREAAVRELAQSEGIDLTFSTGEQAPAPGSVRLIDPADSPLRETYAQEYARLRSHKGVSLEDARERMLEGAYFGTMMVQLGDVDGMVSGAAHTTANTIRPALEFVKTKPDVKIVSSVFFMLLEDRALVYGDCAVNPNPDAEQLADIARASAQTAQEFGVDPKVAMLSYSTGGSGSGADVDKVREATRLVRDADPAFEVEGPIQYDAATNASIAASKLPESQVAGRATVFVFPDLNTGNNTYKAVQQSSGAVAVGPVLQGLRKPVNDLSRGCTVDDIVNTVAITAIQAQTA
ncbi:phosphate acetyltransferase [Rothia sp. AR01]|uniref:Phosphate acetyltransferase n=1 Tax=Rothia santali TaxID=2949643 RepID=A0A9X2HDV9_9MICC|nr:phosphate acetyltransferase [Rothia santali]MCP3425892.1 phosphate acetyltransferase [Rothia santali]